VFDIFVLAFFADMCLLASGADASFAVQRVARHNMDPLQKFAELKLL
jgi:hypothetical protein